MPIIKSAAKRVRQTTKKTARNRAFKRQLKDATRTFEVALASKSKTTNDALVKLQSTIDTAVKKNLIHKNKAARLKSRYAHAMKAGGIKLNVGSNKTPAKKPVTKSPAKPAPKKPAVKKTPAKK